MLRLDVIIWGEGGWRAAVKYVHWQHIYIYKYYKVCSREKRRKPLHSHASTWDPQAGLVRHSSLGTWSLTSRPQSELVMMYIAITLNMST